MKKNLHFRSVAALILIIVSFSACTSRKNVTYFQGESDTTKLVSFQPTSVFKDPVIMKDDILSISILTLDPTSNIMLNQGAPSTPVLGSGTSSSSNSQNINGYLVDKNGEVELSMIGKVKLEGLTSFQARELIKEKAEIYHKEPNVQVRFANFKITVLGEVARPATYTLPNEKVTILDVLGLAGDLTIYGRRENVLLIRDNAGEKQFARLDLSSQDVFNSPYFYLKQGDVIYVEPNKSKIASTDASRTRIITIATSITSALIVLLIRVL